jgi:hypothetical protein
VKVFCLSKIIRGENKMTKKLTLTNINAEHKKQFKEKKNVVLKYGYNIQVDEKFQKTKIQKLVVDYQLMINKFNETDVDSEFVKKFMFITYMLIIKHFTDVDNIPITIDGMVSVCEKLIDLEVLEEIMSSFDIAEIDKVKDELIKFSQTSELYKEQVASLFANTNLVNKESIEYHEEPQSQEL